MDINKIKLIAYDFDGVMTDNKVYVDQKGNEMVRVNRADGLAIGELKKLGIKQIIISTEKNSVVRFRAQKLNIECFTEVNNKKVSLEEYCIVNNIELQLTAFVGNDINDKEVMKIVGKTLCPKDAHDSIKNISNHILQTKGGNGVIRELLDLFKGELNNE